MPKKRIMALPPGAELMPEFADNGVEWTPEEMKQIAKVAYDALVALPDMPRIRAIRQAVETLPQDRQKSIKHWSDVRYFIEREFKILDQETGHSFAPPPFHRERLAEQQQEESSPVETKAAAPAKAAPFLDRVPVTASPAPRKKRVIWTPEETETVALEAARLLVTDHDGKLSDLEAVRQAQLAQLPEDRQKVLYQSVNCQEAIDRAVKLMPVVKKNMERKAREEQEARDLEERMRVAEEERIERERLESEVREKALAEAEEIRKRAEADSIRTRAQTEAFSAAVAAEVAKSLDAAPYGQLLAALAKKVMGDFMGSLAEQVKSTVDTEVQSAIAELRKAASSAQVVQVAADTPHLPSNVAELKLAPKDHTPKVIVVGLVNQQFDDLKKTFFGMAEFVLVKSQAASGPGGGNTGAMMLSAARNERADVVVALVDHCGMDVKSAGLKLEVPFIRLTGSVSTAKRWLRQWLNGEISIAA
jgi:hypothetical protein